MRNMYQRALQTQDACNLSGLAIDLARVVDTLWDEARRIGLGTAHVNRHPVVILYLAQMVYLATGDCLDSQAYCAALKVCKNMAKIESAQEGGMQ